MMQVRLWQAETLDGELDEDDVDGKSEFPVYFPMGHLSVWGEILLGRDTGTPVYMQF